MRPARALIDLQALRHNYQLAREVTGAKALAVIKADAYGHGAVRCAQALEGEADRLMLREGLLVAFFLGGLVVLGGMQQWWLQPIVSGLEPLALFAGALGLTAITDNAALTYLGSLIEGISPAAQYALVAGAVAGGGLTVIANAPNPAGVALLKNGFADQTIGAGGLQRTGHAGFPLAQAMILRRIGWFWGLFRHGFVSRLWCRFGRNLRDGHLWIYRLW